MVRFFGLFVCLSVAIVTCDSMLDILLMFILVHIFHVSFGEIPNEEIVHLIFH